MSIDLASPRQDLTVERFTAAEHKLLRSLGLQATSRWIQPPELGLRVRVLEFGAGRPVVLLPGLGAVAAAWAPLLAGLKGFRFLAVERPGCGLSDGFDLRGLDLRRWSTLLASSVIDALGLDRVSIIGNSIGGTTALWYAIERPERVDKLVLIGAPPFVLDAQAPLPMRVLSIPFIARRSLAKSGPQEIDNVFVRMGHRSGVLGAEMQELVAATYRLPGYADGFVGVLNNATGLMSRRVEAPAAELATIGRPTLLIWGRNDTHGPVATGRRLVKTMPDARLEIVEGGHLPWLDEPGRCANLVNSFLADSEAEPQPL